jgi:ABC-type Fe3+ transport system permease subunit
VSRAGNGSAWGSAVVGLASVATLPVAIYATRFSGSYDLLHAGFAIPVAAVLGLAALALSRRARRRTSVSLVGGSGHGAATAGRVLGVLGLCLAASALVALGVYGLLEYVGSRE